MMVIDTSALVAIAFHEPEREVFVDLLLASDRVLLSTATWLETRMVAQGRKGQRAVILLDELLRLPIFEQVPPGSEEARVAYEAFVTYGRGSGHPAGLNYGDLFSYALAKVRGLPLLFKGEDFAQTDLIPVWRPA